MPHLFFRDVVPSSAILDASESLCELSDRISPDCAATSVDRCYQFIVATFMISVLWEMKRRERQSQRRKV